MNPNPQAQQQKSQPDARAFSADPNKQASSQQIKPGSNPQDRANFEASNKQPSAQQNEEDDEEMEASSCSSGNAKNDPYKKAGAQSR